jgi:RNA-splicing ligase RtcB
VAKQSVFACLVQRQVLRGSILNTEAGQEYWFAMNLAGDYASANHHQIHERIAAALGEQPSAASREPPQLCVEGNFSGWLMEQ